jgi:hypothetical protein
MLQFSALGILGLVAVLLCWTLAAVLYRVETVGGVARQFAFLLLVEGFALVSTGYVDMLLAPAVHSRDWYATWFRAEEIVHTLGDCAMLALYPTFLGAVLQTRLTRPFRRKSMRIGIAGAALALFFAVLFSPLEFGATLLYVLLSLLFGFALVASIHAWRVAETGAARARAGAFALAFGFRDVCWGLVYAGAIWLIFTNRYSITEPDPSDPTTWLLTMIYACGTLFYVPLIAYGILRTHLFDIDLRIRWTIRQSTVASVFVAIFYLVSEGVDRYLASELGNLAGLLAAALVVFFLAPLQRFADRVAAAAMPNTQNTPEYVAFRKMQVYEEALAEAQGEDGISARERALLVRLRDSLGISVTDAEAIERELQARLGGSALSAPTG